MRPLPLLLAFFMLLSGPASGADELEDVSPLGSTKQQSLFDSATTAIPNTGPGIPPVDQAFPLTVELQTDGTTRIRWLINEGYYLYRDKFSVMVNDAPVSLYPLPAAETTEDEFFGAVAIYRTALTLDLELPATGILDIGYQGCAEDRYCYPPARAKFDLSSGTRY